MSRRSCSTTRPAGASARSGSTAAASSTPSCRGRAGTSGSDTGLTQGTILALDAARSRSSPATPDDFADVALALDDGFHGDCARALRTVPRGEVVTYGELAALAGRPGRRARRRHVLRALRPARRSCPTHRVVSARRDRLVRRPRRRLQAPPARARGGALRSPMTFATSSPQIAPDRRCCRLAELSALFHASGAWHLRAGELAVHLDLASSAAARRAFALLRELGVRSEIRTYRRRASTARRATSCTSTSTTGARRSSRGGRALGRAARRSSIRRSGSSDAPAAAAPTCAARCSAGARCPARATRTSSSARRGREGAELPRRRRRTRRLELAVVERRRTPSPTRRDTTRSRDLLAAGRRGGHRPAPRGARGRRRDARTSEPARQRGRGEPRPDSRGQRTRSSRRSAHSALDALPPELGEVAELRLRHPSRVAARARRQGAAAADEGSGAPPDATLVEPR